MGSLSVSGLLQAGGALTTTLDSGEQWDAPNTWPPLQLMLIEGLEREGSREALALADDLATKWLQTCMKAWQDTGHMFEKYNALKPGVGGGGGEYVPQVGFGWSNGVALALLLRKTNAKK